MAAAEPVTDEQRGPQGRSVGWVRRVRLGRETRHPLDPERGICVVGIKSDVTPIPHNG